MNKADRFAIDILKNNLTNIKSCINNDCKILQSYNSNGDMPLHTAVRYAQVAYDNNNHEDVKKYQKIADYMVKNGAQLNTHNQFNEIVKLNPDYDEYNQQLSEIDNYSYSKHNNIDSTFNFSDTVVSQTSDQVSDNLKSFLKDGNFHGGGRNDTTSEDGFNNQSLSDIMFEKLSNNTNSLTIDSDEEELVFEDLTTINSNTLDTDMDGGGRRRKRSSKRKGRKRSKSRSRRRRSRKVSRRRKSSRRKSSRRRSSRRRSSRRKSSRRKSSRRKMKRGANPYMQMLKYYRSKLGSSAGKPTDVAKKGGQIWREAKKKAGDNASPDQIIKIAKDIIDKK